MKLNVRAIGTMGQPLVILHGLMGASDNWFTMGKQLAETHRVFLLDQRNHGLSAWSNVWNYEAMADDLQLFIEDNALEKPIIVGHSMGGKTAMLHAGKFPENIDRLAIVDIAPRYYAPHHQTILEGLHSLDLACLASRQEADTQLALHIKETDTRQFLLKNLYRKPDNSFAWRMNLTVITENIGAVGQAFPENLSYAGKTLFMRSEKSNYISDQDAQDLKRFFPNAQIKTVPNAGHWIHAEQPQGFLEVLQAFIAQA